MSEWTRGDLAISTDRARLDLDLIHRFLAASYWARDIPRDVVVRSIDNSLPFGVYTAGAQIGFARVITDYATFGYVGDVFVLEAYRGRGIARWLMETMLAHPDLQGFRRWVLLTRDAHRVYRGVGFTSLEAPEAYMELRAVRSYAEGPRRG